MEGEIDQETHDILAERYNVDEFNLNEKLKYLGIVGSTLAFLGLIGFVTALTQSKVISLIVILCLAYACLHFGSQWKRDPLNQRPHTTRLILIMSLFLVGAALGLLGSILGIRSGFGFIVLSGIWTGMAVAMAYIIQSTFLLVVANLMFFHWVGSWTSMFGRIPMSLPYKIPFYWSWLLQRLFILVNSTATGTDLTLTDLHERTRPSDLSTSICRC